MHIEDFVAVLANNYFITVKDPKHFSVMNSLYLADQFGKGYTEKQKNYAVTIIKQYVPELNKIFNKDISAHLQTPTTKRPIRMISSTKRIELGVDQQWGTVIHVRFPYNEDILSDLKKDRKAFDYHTWQNEEKLWLFALTETNIMQLNSLGIKYHFEFSDEFADLVKQCTTVIDHLEDHVPMLVATTDGGFEYKNAAASVPTLKSDNIVSALFEARQHGITVWDESLTANLGTGLIADYLKNSTFGEHYRINPEVFSIRELCELVKFLSPCVICIPASASNFEKFTSFHEALNSVGIDNSEISVLYRLDNSKENAVEFNQQVKTHALNTPISERTKVVFISEKIPKPLLASGISINTAIHVGGNYHKYAIKLFFNGRQNVIDY